MRLMAYMDSGAVGGDIVGRNWVSHLELHGGVVEPLPAPFRAQWLDPKVHIDVHDKIDMSVLIAGTDVRMAVTFLVAPWDLDHVVIGWNTMVKYGVLKRVEDLIAMQCSLGVSTGIGSSNDVQEITDVDGQLIKTDEFLFCDEAPAAAVVVPETVLTVEQSVEVEGLLNKYATVFDEKPAGSTLVEPMVVTMEAGWVAPPLESFRKYSPRVEAAIKKDLERQIELGVIEESKAMWGCPVHAVPKPDSESGYRFCIDFRPLNAGAVADPYPLPTVSSVLASLAGCKFFAKLDLRNGYWQFPVDEASRHLLAFMLWGKMWQYRVVPMGFKGSSFYTQRSMYGLFVDKFGRGVLIYLGDVVIYAATFEEFLVLLEYVLGVMLRANLACKRSKCVFGMKEIHILRHVVSKKGVWMDEGRIDAVLAVPFPRNAKELRRFLGMTNYMRAFVPHYSLLAKPLTQEVNTPVGEWPQEAMREAFEVLKRAVASQMALTHLDYSVPLVVQADASVLGVGGCLINRRPAGDQVVGCASHAFNATESRWKTIEQEAFAIVFMLLYFRSVLWGHHFLVETDHRNLTFIHSGTSSKLARWSMLLQSLNFAVSYIPGEKNVVADALSRSPRGVALGLHAVRLTDFVAASSLIQLGALQGEELSVEGKCLMPSIMTLWVTLESTRRFARCGIRAMCGCGCRGR